MPRLTITLSEERHHALKEAAVRRGKTLRELIEESLDFYGIKQTSRAASLVAEARKHAALSEQRALEVAIEETKAERQS